MLGLPRVGVSVREVAQNSIFLCILSLSYRSKKRKFVGFAYQGFFGSGQSGTRADYNNVEVKDH